MATLNSLEKNTVTFQAFVSSFIQKHQNGRAYYHIKIKNNNDCLYQAYAWKNEYRGVIIKQAAWMIVTGIHKQYRGESRFQLISLSHKSTKLYYFNKKPDKKLEISQLLHSEHLNEQQKKDLITLQQLFNAIQQPHLKSFLQAIFKNKRLINAFVELPASARHHHKHQGGLLKHSIECVIFVLNATQGSLISRDERELAMVAALLHDIGKIKTLTTENKHSISGHYIQHEQLTLIVLADYITQFENDWPNGAALIMYLLTWEKKNQPFPGNPTALLIKTADQFSTAMDIRKQAFKNKPESFYYTHYKTSSGKQYVNRLTATNHNHL